MPPPPPPPPPSGSGWRDPALRSRSPPEQRCKARRAMSTNTMLGSTAPADAWLNCSRGGPGGGGPGAGVVPVVGPRVRTRVGWRAHGGSAARGAPAPPSRTSLRAHSLGSPRTRTRWLRPSGRFARLHNRLNEMRHAGDSPWWSQPALLSHPDTVLVRVRPIPPDGAIAGESGEPAQMAASARSSTDKTAHCAILRINVLREQLFGLGALLALTEVRVLRGRGLVLRRRGPGGGALNLVGGGRVVRGPCPSWAGAGPS